MPRNVRSKTDEFDDTIVIDQPRIIPVTNPLDKVLEKRRGQAEVKKLIHPLPEWDGDSEPDAFYSASNNVLTLEQKIGRLLRQTRQQKGLDIEKVSHILKIRSRYLEAIEEGRIADIPADVYVKGYIKSYSKLLGINSNQVFENFNTGKHNVPVEEWQTPVSQPGNHFKAKWLVILVSVVLAVVIYGFWHKSNADQTMLTKPAYTSSTTRMSQLGAFIRGPLKEGSKIVLLANNDAELKITPANETTATVHHMKAGDALFVPGHRDGVFISSNNPKSVEVFLDGDNYSFLGTLEEVRSDKQITVR